MDHDHTDLPQQHSTATRAARRLLSKALHSEDRRFVLSDLDEELERKMGDQNEAVARRWFIHQCLGSVIPALRGRFVWSRVERDRTKQHSRYRSKAGFSPSQVFLEAWSDFRHALRGARKQPVSMLVTIISLGIGIGAVTATFSIVDTLLLQPPTGLTDPTRLATIYTAEPGQRRHGTTSYPDFLDIQRNLDAIEDAAATTVRTVAIGDRPARTMLAEEVTPNYFEVARIRPTVGRGFDADLDSSESQRVAFIGHQLWSDSFKADPAVVGQEMLVNRQWFTIVGVAPAGLRSRRVPLAPDIWIPLGTLDTAAVAQERKLRRDERPFQVIARLMDDATLDQLQAQADVLGASLAENHTEWQQSADERTRSLVVVSEKNSRLNPEARALFTAIGLFLLTATGLVLLIACSNVASLTLARSAQRSSELALRVSLGASRGRLIAMLFIESLVPTVASAAVGLAVATWAAHLIRSIELPGGLPIRLDVHVEPRIIGFSLAAAMGTCLVFGLLPAVTTTRKNLLSAVRRASAANRPKWLDPRNLTVVVQCAASLILIATATLFLRSLEFATEVDLGFAPEGVALATVNLDERELDGEQAMVHLESIRERLAARPGVEQVALSRSVEVTLLQIGGDVKVSVPGHESAEFADNRVHRNAVGPGYFELLRVPLLRGRSIESGDLPGATDVAVVNETFAKRFWPSQDPLGRRFRVDSPAPSNQRTGSAPREVTVVGLAKDGKYLDFDDASLPYFWTSLHQDPSSDVVITVKGKGPSDQLIPALHEEIEVKDGEVQRSVPSTLESHLSLQFMHLQIASKVLGFGGGFGLFLAVIGIYGVVALAVSQRRKEIAIRSALGASHQQLFAAVLAQGLRLAALGLFVGLLVALPGTRALRSVLAGIAPNDPLAFGGAVLLLLMASFVASAIPASTVARLNPMRTLREE